MILVACAVERELRAWHSRPGIATLATGVGPVEAACAVAAELARERYDLVVSAGIAGAFEGVARVGDGVVVSDETFDLSREDGTPIVLPDAERIEDAARSDVELVAALRRRGFAALRGVTVAHVTTSEATARRLANRGAQIESMEGFAVLRACERAAVRAVEVRGISNRVGTRERSGWDFDAAAAGLARVMHALFDAVNGASGAAT
jgi:futalosine hydrolase